MKHMTAGSPSNGPFPNLSLLSTESQKSDFHKRKNVIFTVGISQRYVSGFGVCSDDWKKEEKRKKQNKTKTNRTIENDYS